jgi:hypothetical protein
MFKIDKIIRNVNFKWEGIEMKMKKLKITSKEIKESKVKSESQIINNK